MISITIFWGLVLLLFRIGDPREAAAGSEAED